MPLNLGDTPDLTNKAIKRMPTYRTKPSSVPKPDLTLLLKKRLKPVPAGVKGLRGPVAQKGLKPIAPMNITGNPLRKRKQSYTVGE